MEGCWSEKRNNIMDFKDFVDASVGRANEDHQKFNRDEVINLYKSRVADFFDRVENEWLSDYVNNGVTITSEETTVFEERLGKYTVDSLIITIGCHNIKLTPIGTILIGTPARIDMEYGSSSAMFVMVGENITCAGDQIEITTNCERTRKRKEPGELVWKYVQNNRQRNYVTVTADTFQKAIMSLINNEESTD